jgi:hypothetical protein
MNRAEVSIDEWTNILDLNYWWVLHAIKEDIKRGMTYELNNHGNISIIRLDENGEFIF